MKVPNFIKPLDIDAERQNIINEFKVKSGKLDYIPLVGDDYMTLIDIFLYRLNHFFELINIKIANNYLNFSSGEYLDELVALVGIKRNDEVKPIAQVEVSVSSATYLPKGTKFTDGAGHFAYLLEDANIADTKVLKIEAEEYFKESYETTTLEIPNIYVTDIKMISPFSGFKARESDDELRARFLLSMHRFSTAGSAKSYLFYILSVEGITKASVYQLRAGVVQIVYLSKFDETTATLKIKEALDGRIPLTDDVRIKEVTQIKVDLVIEIKLLQDFMFSEVLKNATARLKEYFGSLEIGFTPHFSKIIEIAFDENTKAVEVKSQIPNIDRDSILILQNLQISKAN
jgi:baseplate J-like protein|nr:MAG TPA: baseplate assembly protein [Caudoviricetes sp.]